MILTQEFFKYLNFSYSNLAKASDLDKLSENFYYRIENSHKLKILILNILLSIKNIYQQ